MTRPAGPEPAARSRWPVPAAVLLAVLQAALLLHTAWDKADTADEPSYINGALHQWVRNDFRQNCHAPPLPKWGFALALRLLDPDLFEEWRGLPAWAVPDPIFTRPLPRLRHNLLAVRSATVLVTVLGGLFLWSAARSFGPLSGLLAHALWCLSPTVLANGSLATLDAWAASLLCVCAWVTLRLWRTPSVAAWLLLGAALAGAGGSKVTALGAAPVALVLGALAERRSAPARFRLALARGLLACAVGFAVPMWAQYRFDVGVVDTTSLCGTPRSYGDVRLGPVPFPLFFEGALLQVRRGEVGFHNYLLGEVRRTGWWSFYAVALALKTTIGAQFLALLAAAVRRRARLPGGGWTDAALLAYPVLLLAVMSRGETQSGIRYVLPAFPFGILWVARAAPAIAERWPIGRLLLGGLVTLGAAESLARHPHHLMFFNMWIGGPDRGPFYLVHGDDWGQDQRRLAEWQKANGVRRLIYGRYTGEPEAWGITYRPVPCRPRLPGRYALHAVEVHRPKRVEPGCYDWLTVEPPDEKIGWSIYLWRVDEARLQRLMRWRAVERPFWRSGSPGTPAPPEPPEPTSGSPTPE